MSEACTNNCATCGQDCASRKQESLLANLNPKSKVKKTFVPPQKQGGVKIEEEDVAEGTRKLFTLLSEAKVI